MGEWGSEEDLIECARDGEALSDSSATQSSNTSGFAPNDGGLRVPSTEDSTWEDVISLAKERLGS